MTEPNIVTPQEAQEALRDFAGSPSTFLARVTRTVATEPERTDATVIKALEAVIDLARASGQSSQAAEAFLDVIKNGADQ